MIWIEHLGPPLAGMRIEIRGDDGTELPALRTGGVWISGECVMQRYYQDPRATEEVRRGDWLDTGDVDFLDTDGELVLTGREKELIIQNGRNIHPRDSSRSRSARLAEPPATVSWPRNIERAGAARM